jgi:hypothetical protein
MPNQYTKRGNMEHWDKSKQIFFNFGIRRYSSVNIALRMPLFETGGGGLAVIAFLDEPQKYSSDYVGTRQGKGKY